MSKDHYIAQTYLNNFVNSDNKLIPYYKNKKVIMGKSCSAKSVCFKYDGNTNDHFSDERVLEKYIDEHERNWNSNIDKLIAGNVDLDIKHSISTYLAFLRTCTPTAIKNRRYSEATFIQNTAKFMAERNMLPNEGLTPEVENRMNSMILNDEIEVTVDEKYAQAKNMETMEFAAINWCYAEWVVLFEKKGSYLTSDNPLCVYHPYNNLNVTWFYVPLKPDTALLIKPRSETKRLIRESRYNDIEVINTKYGNIKFDWKRRFNRNLVRHASEKVFSNIKAKWIERLVERNQHWQHESVIDVIPTGENETINIVSDRLINKSCD